MKYKRGLCQQNCISFYLGSANRPCFKSNTLHKEENVKGRYIGQNIRLITDIMKVTELEIYVLWPFLLILKKNSIRWIGTSFLRRCKFLTLAHAFKTGLEPFTPIVPAVLLTMDSHLSFSKWKVCPSRLSALWLPLCSMRGNFS